MGFRVCTSHRTHFHTLLAEESRFLVFRVACNVFQVLHLFRQFYSQRGSDGSPSSRCMEWISRIGA